MSPSNDSWQLCASSCTCIACDVCCGHRLADCPSRCSHRWCGPGSSLKSTQHPCSAFTTGPLMKPSQSSTLMQLSWKASTQSCWIWLCQTGQPRRKTSSRDIGVLLLRGSPFWNQRLPSAFVCHLLCATLTNTSSCNHWPRQLHFAVKSSSSYVHSLSMCMQSHTSKF